MVECTALEMRHGCKPIGGSNPPLSAKGFLYGPETWVTERTYDRGDNLVPNGLVQIDVSQIIVHEAQEPNSVVDFGDAEFLAREHG